MSKLPGQDDKTPIRVPSSKKHSYREVHVTVVRIVVNMVLPVDSHNKGIPQCLSNSYKQALTVHMCDDNTAVQLQQEHSTPQTLFRQLLPSLPVAMTVSRTYTMPRGPISDPITSII